MYLSRIELDMTQATTRRALSSQQVMHAIVEGCFKETQRKLWRLDKLKGKDYMLILSETVPNFTHLVAQLCAVGITGETKDYTKLLSSVKVGQQLGFRLCAAPTRKDPKDGKVYAHVTPEQQKTWLIKKAESNGFKLHEFAVLGSTFNKFYRGTAVKGANVEFKSAVFEGVLEVTDVDAFVKAMVGGVGRSKAYGCGLLTVMPLGVVL